jgi:uncharacterized damage-inducible protein DinB
MQDLLLDTLFQYESWATRNVLQECCALTQARCEQPLGLGHGNLERTLAHLVGVLTFFADRLNRQMPRPRPDRDGSTHTPAELLALFDLADVELREAVNRALSTRALTDLLNWTDTDEGDIDPLDKVTYAVAFAQMLDHSNHHRTQAIDMLRLLGVEQSMEWHPFEWDEAVRSNTSRGSSPAPPSP